MKKELKKILEDNHVCNPVEDYYGCIAYQEGWIDKDCINCLKQQIKNREKQIEDLKRIFNEP